MITNQIVLSFFYSSKRGSGNELSFVIYICLFTDACCYIYCGKYSKSCLSMFTLYVNTFLEWMSIRPRTSEFTGLSGIMHHAHQLELSVMWYSHKPYINISWRFRRESGEQSNEFLGMMRAY